MNETKAGVAKETVLKGLEEYWRRNRESSFAKLVGGALLGSQFVSIEGDAAILARMEVVYCNKKPCADVCVDQPRIKRLDMHITEFVNRIRKVWEEKCPTFTFSQFIGPVIVGPGFRSFLSDEDVLEHFS